MNEYSRYQIDNIEVFVRRDAVMTAPEVKVEMAGFWKFRWLTVSGISALSMC